MSPEQSKYFDEMDVLFGSQGWKNFIEDIQMRQTSERDNLLNSKQTSADIQASFNRNEVYSYILGLEQVLDEVKKQLVEAEYE